ncbi:MAG: hypothetical protein HS105_08445 [Chloracidobacterium sp.]|nr:hypothetical protein [Chloracidobacterium sp.]MCO5334046.1 hypothetical protein [Pyrinomonadaceae bacterium]
MRSSILYTSLLAALFVVLSIGTAFAQTKQQKKPIKRTASKTAPTRTLTGAEIINQGGVLYDPADVQQQAEEPLSEPPSTDDSAAKIKELSSRIKKLESSRPDPYEEQQKRLLTNLDILTRAEQRSESLRRQIFDLLDRENSVKLRLDQISTAILPEAIEREVATAGSLRPEVLREQRRKSLESERQNLQALLAEISATKDNLQQSLLRSDQLVEKLRNRLEKDIDTAIAEPDEN